MILRRVIKTSDLLALIKRIDEEGEIEEERLYAGLQRLDRHDRQDPTPFDRADEEYGVGRSGWPPTGRWPNNDQAKQTQEARVDL